MTWIEVWTTVFATACAFVGAAGCLILPMVHDMARAERAGAGRLGRLLVINGGLQ